MHGFRGAAIAAALPVLAAVVVTGARAFDTATSQRLAAAALGGRSFEDVQALTDRIGARLTASDAYQRAAEWAAGRFRDAGVSTVKLESFAIPRAWGRGGEASARIVSPVEQRLAVAALGWTPPTDGEVEGDVVAASDRLPSPDQMAGRIVLVAGDVSAAVEARLAMAGARALLFADPDRGDQLTARVRRFGGDISTLPAASITRDDAATLRRLAAQGAVRLRLRLPSVVSSGPALVNNVIAEIPGRDRSDEWILVGAHLDSWDPATGAQDNATGVAMVIDAARAIARLGRGPRRTIRFALWGGEEQGLLGSSAYVRAHEGELDGAVAVLNADGGTGRILGWTTPGREDVEAQVRDLARSLLAGLDASAVDHGLQYAFDSDGGPFLRQGVPVLDLNVDDRHYDEIHHKATDALDRVDRKNLAIGAATVAVTAYAIADAPSRLFRRGPRRDEK